MRHVQGDIQTRLLFLNNIEGLVLESCGNRAGMGEGLGEGMDGIMLLECSGNCGASDEGMFERVSELCSRMYAMCPLRRSGSGHGEGVGEGD
jgi:hypothetical protein